MMQTSVNHPNVIWDLVAVVNYQHDTLIASFVESETCNVEGFELNDWWITGTNTIWEERGNRGMFCILSFFLFLWGKDNLITCKGSSVFSVELLIPFWIMLYFSYYTFIPCLSFSQLFVSHIHVLLEFVIF